MNKVRSRSQGRHRREGGGGDKEGPREGSDAEVSDREPEVVEEEEVPITGAHTRGMGAPPAAQRVDIPGQ